MNSVIPLKHCGLCWNILTILNEFTGRSVQRSGLYLCPYISKLWTVSISQAPSFWCIIDLWLILLLPSKQHSLSGVNESMYLLCINQKFPWTFGLKMIWIVFFFLFLLIHAENSPFSFVCVKIIWIKCFKKQLLIRVCDFYHYTYE